MEDISSQTIEVTSEQRGFLPAHIEIGHQPGLSIMIAEAALCSHVTVLWARARTVLGTKLQKADCEKNSSISTPERNEDVSTRHVAFVGVPKA